jgi:hypothetical protein
MNKVKFTTNVDSELLLKIKILCLQEGKTVNELLEILFREYLYTSKK